MLFIDWVVDKLVVKLDFDTQVITREDVERYYPIEEEVASYVIDDS